MASITGLAIGCTAAFSTFTGKNGQHKGADMAMRVFERYWRSTKTWYVSILLAAEVALLSDEFLGPLLDGQSFPPREFHWGFKTQKLLECRFAQRR